MNKNLKILMLEDVAEDAELIKRELRKEKLKFSSKRVETKETFLKELKDFAPDIILIDYRLPGFDGIAALQLVKKHTPSIPAIIVTGTLSDVKAANCIKFGAADYILKDRLARLGSAIKEALEMKKAREEKKEMEKSLRESEKKYRTLFDTLSLGIFVIDQKTGRILDVNSAATLIYGYSREEFLSMKNTDVSAEPDKTRKATLELPQHIPLRYHRKKDGTIFPVEMSVSFFMLNGRNVVIATSKDITEQKQMEQMLIQSEKMASIGILAAGIAHEINNPTGYIHSNLETLKEHNEEINNFFGDLQTFIEECSKTKSEIIEDLIDKFKKSKEDREIDYLLKDTDNAIMESLDGSEKIKKIVSDLKDFSREEKPEMKLAKINDGIEKILNVIWNELKYKAEVIKEFGDIPEIECDINKLDQVFMNILVNAAQAIEKRGKITIKTFTENNYVVIQISDTGKGIPGEYISKIFDAFYTTKEPGKGTGLGLSISYKIIQEHNGTIDVESEVGKGTTFTIKLPAKKSD